MADKAERDDRLEALFAEARDGALPPGLAARVLADAAEVQAELAADAVVPRPAGSGQTGLAWRPGWIAALGGWGGASGVALAGLVGLAIGLTMPDTIYSLSGGQLWSLSGGAGITPDLATLAWEEGGDV